jgi:uncharacterized protein (DUF302 family)
MAADVLYRAFVSVPPESMVRAVRSTLRRHGFVVAAPLDLQRQLHDRTGAYLPPYVVLFAFSPAATHQVVRCDPAAAATTILPVVIRGSDDEVVVEVPDFPNTAESTTNDVRSGLRARLFDALHEVSVVA